MRAVIAEDAETDKETALLESIESKIDTKLTSMDDEKQRQDAIMMVGDEMEHLSTNFPELSNDVLKEMRTVAMTYSETIADANIKANEKKKEIEKETEDRLLVIDESEEDLRKQIALDSVKSVEKVMGDRTADVDQITAKRNEALISLAPENLKDKVRLFFFPVEDSSAAQPSDSQNENQE